MKKKIVRSINVMLMVVTILCCFSSMAILREAKKVEKPDYYIATDYSIIIRFGIMILPVVKLQV